VRIAHDKAVALARDGAAQLTLRRAADLFVASFDKDKTLLPGRAALAALAVARHLPEHPFRPTTRFSQKYLCGVCGYGLTHGGKVPLDVREVASFFTQWGQALFFPEPAPLGLALVRAAELPDPQPSHEAVDTLRRLLDAIEGTAAAVAPAGVAGRKECLDAIGKVFRGNKYHRAWVFETLAVCGVLPVAGHASYWQAFVPLDDRPDASERNNELDYPARFWTARDGVDRGRAEEVFGHLWHVG
jgi:hypothetical protein